MMRRFKEFVAEDEELAETARASLWRNLTKWGAGNPEGMIDRQVALISAYIKAPRDAMGRVVTDPAQVRNLNRSRNAQLGRDLATAGLSYFPVLGSGQTERQILGFPYIVPSEEGSLVVQPREKTDDEQFTQLLQRLLVKYEQDFAAVKLPSNATAFLLRPDGAKIPLGTTAQPRVPGEPYYTGLVQGPRASDSMLDPWELYGEKNPIRRFINWLRGRSDMNHPRTDRSGRRYVIRNPRPTVKGDDNASAN